ncbi:hypothetical protein GCM10009823_22580 [Brevibacterium salitolerans]|uniref:Uncharacterized protein n=2 Tax=Brevibacterium salitolerans TaxID=1403566 RepID=A0ABN2WW59_9MICO
MSFQNRHRRERFGTWAFGILDRMNPSAPSPSFAPVPEDDSQTPDPARTQAAAAALLELYGDDLRRTGLAVDPGLAAWLPEDFTAKVRAATGGGPVPVAVLVHYGFPAPAVRQNVTYPVDVMQRVAAELFADGEGVLAAFAVDGGTPDPAVHAVGARGVSDRLFRLGEALEVEADFRVRPEPYVEYAAAAGRAWLRNESPPDLGDYVSRRIEAGTGRFFETHTPGGADGLVASTAAVGGAAAITWAIARRTRAEREASGSARTTAASSLGTGRAKRLLSALHTPPRLPDPDAADGPEALAPAERLRELGRARERLVSRILAAAPSLDDPQLSPTEARRVFAERVPVTDSAALHALDAQIAAQRGAKTRSVLSPLCFFDPFHGEAVATVRLDARGRRVDAFDVPACRDCRRRDAVGERPHALTVPARGRRAGAPVPYWELDDAYARCGLGTLSPLTEVVAAQPSGGGASPAGAAALAAGRTGSSHTAAGAESLGLRGMERGEAVVRGLAVLVLTVFAAVLGGAASVVIHEYEEPQLFGYQQGPETRADYDRTRPQEIAAELDETGFHIDPMLAPALDSERVAALAEAAGEAEHVSVAVLQSSGTDASDAPEVFAARIAAELSEPGAVIAVFESENAVAAAGMTLPEYADMWRPWDEYRYERYERLAGGDLSGWSTSGEHTGLEDTQREVAELDARLVPDPEVVPDTHEERSAEEPALGPAVLGYPLGNWVRGALIGALGAVTVGGITGALIRGVRHTRSERGSRS